MNSLFQIAKHRPMLRVTGQVLLAFCCAAPLVLAYTLNDDGRMFSTLFQFHLCCSTLGCQYCRQKPLREKASASPLR